MKQELEICVKYLGTRNDVVKKSYDMLKSIINNKD